MPPKTYLFLSVLCHVAVAALCWFGPSLPTIELAGLTLPGQPPSQKASVRVRLKKEDVASSKSRDDQSPQQQKDPLPPNLGGRLASAEPQQPNLPAGGERSVERPEPTTVSQVQRKVGPDGHSQEELAASGEPPASIRYAGTPQEPQPIDRPQLHPQAEEAVHPRAMTMTASASTGDVQRPRSGTEVLPGADAHSHDDGLQAPAFNVSLPPDDIDLILLAHQGVLLVLCEQEQYLVEGTLNHPVQVFPATSQRLRTFSERALQVPAGYCQQICNRLQRDFAMSESQVQRCRFHLLLTNQVDYLVLQRQQAAANRLRYSLENLAATFGRFTFMDQQVTDYQIQTVALTDGRRLSLASASGLSGDLETR